MVPFYLKWASAILTGVTLDTIAIQCLWGWFVTPLGLPTLSPAHACGLGIFVRHLSNSDRVTTLLTALIEFEGRGFRAVLFPLIRLFVMPPLVVAFGAFLTLFL